MSTLTGEGNVEILHGVSDLQNYFEQFIKTPKERLVGVEAEFFAVDQNTGAARSYLGDGGIEAILRLLAERFRYERVFENEHIIKLKREDASITLEPGGQVELSASPVCNVFDVEKQIQRFIEELKSVAESLPGLAWISVGIQPFSKIDEVSWVPKRRYEIMRRYMGQRGQLSHHMMKMTATNQVNLDYTSEADAMDALRVALGVTSIMTALFSNSSFSAGAANNFMTRRLDIWNQTDADRSGLLLNFTEPECRFKDYLNYLLKMPMMFLVRDGMWIPVKGMRFEDFINKGYEGFQATLGDFELHMSGAFPEVRLKQYIEIRGIDAQPPELITSMAAFWKGLLYEAGARQAAWDLVAFASREERHALHREVAKKGLAATLGGKPILPLARELVDLSCAGLRKQQPEGYANDECLFLERIREHILRPGKSSAERLLEHWSGELNRDPAKLVEYLHI